jgi:hypothetical protein
MFRIMELCALLHNDIEFVSLICAIIYSRHLKYETYNSETAASPTALTTSELSELSKISRETVRRKLLVMTKLGLVKRDAQGWRMVESQKSDRILYFVDSLGAASGGDIGKHLSAIKDLLITLELDPVAPASAAIKRRRRSGTANPSAVVG